jgi:hypothetical protein
MPVTKQTYTVASPWNNAQMAAGFRDAFIGAGLMTDWYDSFLDTGIEHRILEITYDASKAYGKTYYWFKFANSQVYVHIASGWNATTRKPNGTRLVDYYSDSTTLADATNRVNNVSTIVTNSLNTNTTTTITRFTSQVDASFTWFLVRNGSLNLNFHINRNPPLSWIDLNKVFYTSMMWQRSWVTGSSGGAAFVLFPMATRRSHLGRALGVDTNPFFYGASSFTLFRDYDRSIFQTLAYHFSGNRPNENANSNPSFGDSNGVLFPVNFLGNPSYTAVDNPIFNGFPLTAYSAGVLPSDFGIASYFGSNTMASFDQFVVTPSVEVYDIIQVTNSGQANNGYVSPMFLARVI